MKRTHLIGALLLLVLLPGCKKTERPADPPAQLSVPVADNRIERLESQLADIRSLLAARPVAEAPKKKYTGCYVHVARGWVCPPCDHFKKDIKTLAKEGWTAGDKGDVDFLYVYHDPGDNQEVPLFEFVKNDEPFGEPILGYNGVLKEIILAHPRSRKTPKRAALTGWTQPAPVYAAEAPVYIYGLPAPPPQAYYQQDFLFGVPVPFTGR